MSTVTIYWLNHNNAMPIQTPFCLVFDQQEFESVSAGLSPKDPHHGYWQIGKAAYATTHWCVDEDERVHAVVAFRYDAKRDPIDVACLLVHEAVHIFQQHCEMIGEKLPSSEYEAYSIQHIANELMREYRRRVALM